MIMNEKLNKYFDSNDMDYLLRELETHQRSNIINDKYFAKIGKNSDELFFNNLKRELTIYLDNPNNIFLPKLIDYYVDDNVCLIILERIAGKTIGESRNSFNTSLTEQERINVSKAVLSIKNINVIGNLDNSYDRKEKFNKYLEKSKSYISKNIYDTLIELENDIIVENYNRVVAHGDLISTNIIVNNDEIYFIDWEFISYKPMFYDLVYFLLFSKDNDSIDALYKLELSDEEIKESLKDGISICLKEIQNNAKLYGNLDKLIVDNNIKRWVSELAGILDLID